MGKICQPQSEGPLQTVTFVSVGPDLARDVPQMAQRSVPTQIRSSPVDVYLDHFACRLQRSQFTPDFQDVAAELLPLIHSSPSLHDIVLAIGALDASRRCSVKSSVARDSPKATAFHLYGKSIKAFQWRLENLDGGSNEDLLWTTFFFGLFEVSPDQLCPVA